MTIPDASDIESELNAASEALAAFAQGPARRAADEVALSFERAGERIARALGSAAGGGEAAFKRMAKTILEELAKIALDRIFRTGGGSPFGGSGQSNPTLGANPVAVHFHLGAGGDPNAIARNQGQIAAAIARAVAYGGRYL
ncbi:MAG: phage tail tape measure C-terminal domain-containing protein [Terricaulis sp.]